MDVTKDEETRKVISDLKDLLAELRVNIEQIRSILVIEPKAKVPRQ